MSLVDATAVTPRPIEPATLEGAGLTFDLVAQLVLKTLHAGGELAGGELAARLGLRFSVVEPSLHFLTRERLCEIAGGSMLGGPTYRYRLTKRGQAGAGQHLGHNEYVGPAPVPLTQYRSYLAEFQRTAPAAASRDRMRAAMDHLVLGDPTLDQLAPAIAGGRALLLYGPPGNGKTTIGRAIGGLLASDEYIPHAIEVEGAIIRVFSRLSHDPLAPPDPGMVQYAGHDQRWVRCRRPALAVGRELTLDSLGLHQEGPGLYRAPVQILANGGLLLIDDLGRQRSAAPEILNRCLGFLENQVDSLTLQFGLKVEIPCTPQVVFTTNLRLADLADEALVCRIDYKVHARNPTRDEFLRIFERCCQSEGVAYDRGLVEHMLANWFQSRKLPLRGCQPRDLLRQALALARYLGKPKALSIELLEAACVTYFGEDGDEGDEGVAGRQQG